MAVLIGVDEAGVGPRLGPMVVAAVALRTPESCQPREPWRVLRRVVRRRHSRRDPRPAVGDSKEVYAAGGLHALDRTVRAFVNAAAGPETGPVALSTLAEVLDHLADEPASLPCSAYPWYALDGMDPCAGLQAHEDCPHVTGRKLQRTLRRRAVELVALRARPVLVGEFNRHVAHGHNKGALLLHQTETLLGRVLSTCANEPVLITLDRQGGRKFYVPMLTRLFPGVWLDTIQEDDRASVYRVRRPEAPVEVRVEVRAEQRAFCVALASILAKYTRERFMSRLNAFFSAQVPDLRPTAGYAGDAPRFLRIIRPVLRQLGIPETLLVRSC